MSSALHLPNRMSVAEFQDWRPPAGLEDRRWSLIDGEPRCMAPASLTHGLLQAELTFLLLQHLRATKSSCRVVVAPGVIPHVESQHNERVPDLAVTCSPQPDSRTIVDPVLLIEILSPSNEADTRRNVWAYTTIPSVTEILLLSSTSVIGELLRRDANGAWPIAPAPLVESSSLRLDSIGFVGSMRDFYAATRLVV